MHSTSDVNAAVLLKHSSCALRPGLLQAVHEPRLVCLATCRALIAMLDLHPDQAVQLH